MKKKNLFFVIIFSTVVSIFNMLYYSSVVIKAKYYEENNLRKQVVAECKKVYICPENINNNQGKVVKEAEEEYSNVRKNLGKEDLAKKELSDEEKGSNNLNINSLSEDIEKKMDKNMLNDIDSLGKEDSQEELNYNTKKQAQSVFKVSTGKIQENLTTSDKVKLLYVSLQLGKENYKKVEEYLYAVDAEEGVLKALKLLKDDLSKKEYGKVRKIAGKFIDMDAAERLK
ncbi:hypothetical protein [Clostridium tagluense]|uniref:hypothetical protein n=1 Tax=Clostridium tagluense TaxID=360422 RepID=UPI001C6E7282|nr:hypothetical protein [Clostridium tagluense]MBW9155357.1 hypothetical protein [Clostridium tagluense]WLC65996.1 hypothetical protein KTC93_01725 [Clostridium tagluense]